MRFQVNGARQVKVWHDDGHPEIRMAGRPLGVIEEPSVEAAERTAAEAWPDWVVTLRLLSPEKESVA